ncbi:extracellular catalytic domain type 1 short-chain-length polyhydroxyalkanoate depolymerase [Rhizocola hellebori]|nr:PHB depolymerase family esterase [Rhizocola hellebori]
MGLRRLLVASLIVLLPAACTSPAKRDDAAPATTPGGVVATTPVTVGAAVSVKLDDRPFQLYVPNSYTATAKMPLVVLLHGFQSSAAQQERYFKLTAEAERRGFLYAMPDGSQNRNGNRFWNATAACCDFGGIGVDDSGYLSRLIDTVKSSYSVDPRRVYFVGHSNGGFMAYRMACEHATQITAIVSLAGAATNDAAQCKPARPVSVLQIHGSADSTIRYEGGLNVGQPYPSAAQTLASWRGHDGCADTADTSAAPIDLDAGLSGAETAVTTYRSGCRDATVVQLWSIKDGRHVPSLSAAFAPAVMDFLLAQVSPA